MQTGDDDIEALQRRIEALEAALRARDEFLAVAGHELRNPLAPVLLDVHRLLTMARKSDGSVPAALLIARLEAFERRLQRFLDVLNRLLDVSRIEAGRIDLMLETVDFSDLLREVVVGFQRELAAARSDLRLSIQPQVIGQWDRLRLEQVCGNLLSNAIRYGTGQPIAVELTADENAAVLRVRDQGIGISEQDQVRIFERFERGEQRLRVGGFGVGLWIVSRLCSAMGGSIGVESRIGQGTTFTVTLPRNGAKGP